MNVYAAIRIVLHPAGVVHLDPLESKSAGNDPSGRRNTGLLYQTNGYGHHLAFPVWGVSSRERTPGTMKPSYSDLIGSC